MKIRIGYGLGTHTVTNDGATFGPFVDVLEDLRFDSLWLSERLTGTAPDPMTALAFAAGRTLRLKLGTSVLVLPGRNPVVLAKEMASLDRLSGGRFLPAVGLGAPNPVEHRAFGVQRAERGPWFDEALALMRRLWTEDDVTHQGPRFTVEGLSLQVKPVQQPLEVWLGGQARSELERVGRLSDGWLPSFCTPASVEEGLAVVTAAAAAHDRRIDDEHIGALIAYSRSAIPDEVQALLARRNSPVNPADAIPIGLDALRDQIEGFVKVGASKFVLVPLDEPASWENELAEIADAVLDLQV